MLKEKLLEALRAADTNLTAKQLAEAIGRKDGSLNSYDRKMLREMESAGMVIIEQETIGVAGIMFLYRIA